ncbi:MAG: N-acetyltransferase [Candidatus Heimdallarchaeota archaeon]|nr:N-acetyltransferase [Candidatus Heimdallarchaeota archaeon]MDH5646121.1 N-acetyltransferase [Candidatus Heimdallarchaeota archaeon]
MVSKSFQNIVECDIADTAIIYDQVNLYKCKIGNHTKIDSFVYIEGGVEIGENCKIRPFTFIPTGVMIGNNVFIGSNVNFTNDKYPKIGMDWELLQTVVKDNVSIGSGSTIIPGIVINENSLIAAGSVVTKDVPSNTLVAGNPARIIRTLT